MKLIENMDDLKKNIKKFDEYMDKGGVSREFLLNLISGGHCFVVANRNGKRSFYPSKYIGYKDMTVEKYCLADNGRDTNRTINKILKCRSIKDMLLSNDYNYFCINAGINTSENKKFRLNEIMYD